MKKVLFFFTLLIMLSNVAFTQTAILHLKFKNSTATSCHIWIPAITFNFDYLKKGSFNIGLTDGKGVHKFNIAKPQFVYLTCSNGDADSAKTYKFALYISPGDNIIFKADFKDINNGVVVTGKGSNNNQPLLSAVANVNINAMSGDTLPDRVIAVLKQHQATIKILLNKYVALYKPTADFVKNEKINIQYDVAYQYFDFKGNNQYKIGKAYTRNESKWNAIQDSLFSITKINNHGALTAASYDLLLVEFLRREKERLWRESRIHPEAFFRKWYYSDVNTGQKIFEEDEQNLLQEKIINYYFTNELAEYMYGALFDDALGEHKPNNLVKIFDGFKRKHPRSKYVKWYGQTIDRIRYQESRALSADIIFVADNGAKLNSLNDLLKLAKGKTILLDMWGTWCLPCRNEITNNVPAIKTHFKNKSLSYFYVANHDLAHKDEWKKLIAYYDLKGTHILANDSLTNDIMTKVKGTGYPTYVIIKKDGTYELSKAGYPMNRDVLFKEIEEALAL